MEKKYISPRPGGWNNPTPLPEKAPGAKRQNPEFHEHKAALQFLALQYPKVEYFSDGSGQNVGKQAGGILTALRKSRGISDIIIPEPTARFCGLFIEMKTTGEDLFQKRDRRKWKNPHTEEQAVFLAKMLNKGYFATFAIGTEHAIEIINKYFRDAADLRPFPEHALPKPLELRIHKIPIAVSEFSKLFKK